MIAFISGLILVAVSGVAGWAGRQSKRGAIAYQVLLAAGCALAMIDPVRVLASGTALTFSTQWTLPGGAFIIGIDALSATFLLVVLTVGAMCALYGVPLLGAAKRRHAAWLSHAWFGLLLSAIALVVAARTVMVFLIAWEVMAVVSYLLIVTDYEHAEVRRSGLIYFVATHTATLAMFALFAILSQGGPNWSFDALERGARVLSPGAVGVVLVLSLVSFGFKAGIVPLHFWLPPAHSAAPSHVSALMSGIVIKTGIYGMLRVMLLLGGAPAWWGWLLLALGVASGVLGVLWALAQHDLKRLLAYHSVENIGIIVMGIGVGVLGTAYGHPAVAVLGFAGALLHTVNHALFKSLLFLGAGAAYAATGTREIDELGGLARRMPITWLAFALGATAIIGVPPLNGFVSEWLVYQGLSGAGQSHEAIRLAVFGIPALALIGALALACFAKAGGVAFLGTPRSAAASGAHEVGAGMLVPMMVLAAACVLLGVVPVTGIGLVTRAATTLAGAPDGALPAGVIAGAWSISLIAVIALAIGGGLWGLRRAALRGRVVRQERTWNCGYALPTPHAQYTASSFASPLVSLFGTLIGLRVERSRDSFHTHPRDLVLDDVALPLWRTAQRAALRLRPIQQGRLYWYLLYVMAALLALLAYLAFGYRR